MTPRRTSRGSGAARVTDGMDGGVSDRASRPVPDDVGRDHVAEGSPALLHAVAELARLAGDVALGYFDQARRSELPVSYKADGSPVTAADRGAEAAAREWIERHFRMDGILGEELGLIRPRARRRWVLDPIDGTKSFLRGVPLWGTLVAVAEGEAVLAGAIYCAAAGEMVAAAVGQGCWWNGARCRVSAEDDLSRATVLTTDDRFPVVTADAGASAALVRSERERMLAGWNRVAERAAIGRTWGDCYGYLLVATGRAEAMMDAVMAPWDTAALHPVITEAGGWFTDWAGVPTAFGGSSVATNAALGPRIRALLHVGRKAAMGTKT
jgi:histidinol-phosphatase